MAPEPPKPVNITYVLAIYSKTEMEKGEKQWKPSNTFLQLKSDLNWDTIKVQLLEKISQALQPKTISYAKYDITLVVPCYQGSHMQLQTEDNYKFLLAHALKPKEPTVNVKIEAKLTKVHIQHKYLDICMCLPHI